MTGDRSGTEEDHDIKYQHQLSKHSHCMYSHIVVQYIEVLTSKGKQKALEFTALNKEFTAINSHLLNPYVNHM